MMRLRSRRSAALLLGLAGLIVIALLPVRVARGDDIAIARAQRPVGAIVKGVAVRQEFPAAGTEIGAVGLILGMAGSVNHGTLDVTIEAQDGGQWRTLATATVRKETLPDTADAFHSLAFAPPLAVTVGQPLRITVQSPDTDMASAATWWLDTAGARDGYAAFFNGERQKGALCFSVSYHRPARPLIAMLRPAWARVTILLSPGGRAALLIGLCLLAATLFVVARRALDTPSD